jgi:hypothetical protein
MPSLLASCPIAFSELGLQLSLKLLIKGEFCHWATAEPPAMPIAAAVPMANKVRFGSSDIAVLLIAVLGGSCRGKQMAGESQSAETLCC